MAPGDGNSNTRQGPERRTSRPPEVRARISDALERCRVELSRRVSGGVHTPATPSAATLPDSLVASLREPVAEFTLIAARERIPPERALIIFKKMVGDLGDLGGLRPEERRDLQRQLIETAIQTFYSVRENGNRPAPEVGA